MSVAGGSWRECLSASLYAAKAGSGLCRLHRKAAVQGICGPNSIGVAVSPDNSKVYVTCTGGSVLVINAATYAVTATIPVSGVPYGVAVTPNGSKVGLSGISCAVGGWTNQAIANVKRSPKRTANWALAMDHSRGGMIHCFSERFKTRKRSLVAASSLGK